MALNDFVVSYAETGSNIATLSGSQTVDSVAIPVYEVPVVVLLAVQTDGRENGPWEVRSHAWTRPLWWSVSGQARPGQAFSVLFGTSQHRTFYVNAAAAPSPNEIRLGSSQLTFTVDVVGAATAVATAHVAGDGSDHADVFTNSAHVAGDGSDHADVFTNSAHVAGDGSDHADVFTNSAHVAGNGSDHANVAANTAAIAGLSEIARYTLAADSQLVASVIGAATEAIHTAQTLAVADQGTARRTVRYTGSLYADSNNGSDTWRVRWRLGGLAGVLLLDTGAWALLTGERIEFEIEITIRTTGTPGTFDSHATARKLGGPGGPVEYEHTVTGGAVTTTTTTALVVTGESDGNSAAQQVTLRRATATVMGA